MIRRYVPSPRHGDDGNSSCQRLSQSKENPGHLLGLPLSLLFVNAARNNFTHFHIKKHTKNERHTHKHRESDGKRHEHVPTCENVFCTALVQNSNAPLSADLKHSCWAAACPSAYNIQTTTRNIDENQKGSRLLILQK